MSELERPRLTTPFVVVADGGRAYLGMLQDPFSSEAYSGVPIIHAHSIPHSQQLDTIEIRPPPEGQSDPRDNETLKQALERMGLLNDHQAPITNRASAPRPQPVERKNVVEGDLAVGKTIPVHTELWCDPVPPRDNTTVQGHRDKQHHL